ncbi:protein kinase domain containing protein, partial [Entamoeba invadens IP1]
SQIRGCAVQPTTLGCSQCSDGYFSYQNSCAKCNENCSTCYSLKECLTCSEDRVLISGNCYSKEDIQHCSSVINSKCNKCSFWHSPNKNGEVCDSQPEAWFIVILIVIILLIILLLVLAIYVLSRMYLIYDKRKRLSKKMCLFKISHSNVEFLSVFNEIMTNKKEVIFEELSDEDGKIGVKSESKELLCIGSCCESTLKVQISIKDNTKYQLRTIPEVATLVKGYACEFEIFLTPLCSCYIEDDVLLVVKNMELGTENNVHMKIKAETLLTTILDYEELQEEKKLGAGSFGIVYLGTFRGQKVAIKKMKEKEDSNNAMEEFTKEVDMLDKFRSEYIVHFYGAVFIPSKICMVTEFAQFGSIEDLMKHKTSEEMSEKLRIKLMIDSAKGLSYLHTNGILHRDIKPDNTLVFSLDLNEKVNAKLTDFGASRNINMMMTNMTFTKGIGTPKYMAPETLEKRNYKMPADIYSFGMTMYEVFGWKSSYPKDEFKYPWDVVTFVTKGWRLKLNGLNEKFADVINACWQQNPHDRILIDQVVAMLEAIYMN